MNESHETTLWKISLSFIATKEKRGWRWRWGPVCEEERRMEGEEEEEEIRAVGRQ